MLGIQKICHLARHLDTTPDRLIEVAETASDFCQEMELFDPTKPERKPRDVLNVRGDLRSFQDLLLKRLLRPKHCPSPFSHGGVKGRHIKSNVGAHTGSNYVFSTDVASFYPTIKNQRVYRLFNQEFKCHPDVARICTMLCTYRYHLALGLITSPILADRIMEVVDIRIANMCDKLGLTYTRYVDDITISGDYPIKSGSTPKLVERILKSHGFSVNREKHAGGLEGLGRLADGTCITKLEVRRGKIRVSGKFMDEIGRQLDDAERLESGKNVQGYDYLHSQILGRIHFVAWGNRGQAAPLECRCGKIDWERVESEAESRGLVAAKKILRPKRKDDDRLRDHCS